MNNIIHIVIDFILKPCAVNTEGINRNKSILSVLFFIFIFIYSCFLLNALKSSIIYTNLQLKQDVAYNQYLLGLVIDIPIIVSLIIFMRISGQSFKTMGIHKKGLKSSLIIGLIFAVTVTIKNRYYVSFSKNDLYIILFSLFLVGINEELLFRGFLWPRLQFLFGNFKAIIITGLLFGLMHLPLQVIWNDYSIIDVLFLGKSNNSNLFGGIVGHLIFGYIYTRNNNILLPSFVHCFLRFI